MHKKNFPFNDLQHKIKRSVHFTPAATKKPTTSGNFKYNQNVNLQLTDFLKTYKLAKLANNYKELNSITQGYKDPVDTYNTTRIKLSAPKVKEAVVKHSVLPISALANVKVTYNTLKELMKYGNYNQLDYPQQRANVQQNKINGYSSKVKLKPQTNVPSNFYQVLNLVAIKSPYPKQKNRTYRFLQTILVKYLETTPNTIKKATDIRQKKVFSALLPQNLNQSTFLQNSKQNTLKNTVYEAINNESYLYSSFNRDQHFLFSKINNKSFLAYWLIPVAGLALLTPKIYSTVHNLHSQQINFSTFRNASWSSDNVNFPFQMLKTNTVNVNAGYSSSYSNKHANDSTNQSKLSQTPFGVNSRTKQNSAYEGHGLEYTFGVTQYDVKSITLNTLYAFINAKTTLVENAHRSKAQLSIFPLFKQHNVTLLNNGLNNTVDSTIRKEESTKAHKHQTTFITAKSFPKVNNIIYKETLQNQISSFNSMLYLTSINPLYSTTLLNNNLNFITTNNSLKLLNFKIIRLNQNKYLKKTTILNSTIPVNKQNNMELKPFSSYNEALNLINLNIKKNAITVKISNDFLMHHKQVSAINYGHIQWPSLDYLNTPEIVRTQFNKVNTYKLLFKQWSDNFSVVQKANLINEISPNAVQNFQVNKNNVLLNYFLLNNKTATTEKKPVTMENVNKAPFKLKINLIKTNISSNIDLVTSFNILAQSNLSKLSRNYQIKNTLKLHSNFNKKHVYSQCIKSKDGLNLYFNFINKKLKNFIFLNNIDSFNRFVILRTPDNTNQLERNLTLQNKNNFTLDFLSSSEKNRSPKYLLTPSKKSVAFKKYSDIQISKQFLNSTSILFKHQKMFKNKSQAVAVRLHLQKKRKAKKQRLETRRQKKRMRFFPRPMWLRYRMFLNFVNQRNFTNMQHNFKINVSPNRLNTNNISSRTCHNSYSNRLAIQSSPTPFAFRYFVDKLNNLHTRDLKLFKPANNVNRILVKKLNEMSVSNLIKMKVKKPAPTKKKQLRDIKIKANYVNFKNQKTNNPPSPADKDKDKDTIFRDFWIWAYNSTAPNNYNQNLWWLLPDNTSPLPLSEQQKGYLPDQLRSKQLKNAFAMARIHWALNKTNYSSFTDYNKRYNLWGTQKLRNQSKNNKTKYLEKQFITNWEKFFLNKKLNLFYKKISSKLNQKTEKLNYLTSEKSSNDHGTAWYKIPATKSTESLSFLPKNIQTFNTAWWSNLNIKPLLTDLTVNKKLDLKTSDNKWSETTSTLLISSTVLLHFCALISLVSISQVRCFVKFHLILLYKLANIYNSLIRKISNTLPEQTSLTFITRIDQPSNGDHKNRLPTNANLNLNLVGQFQNQKKLLTYFSLNLLKKEFSNVIDNSFDHLLNESDKLSNFKLPIVIVGRKSSKLKFALRPTSTRASVELRSKLNILSLKSALLKRPSFRNVLKTTSGNSDNLLQQEETKKRLSVNTLPIKTVGINTNRNSLEYSYKINKTKLNTKKTAHFLVKSSKNFIFKVVFNLIDLFQSSVRSISSFFEKPAEFTTTWIAYGFLVEWSSDLITIIPENVDIYIWNVFSKMTRITPISFIFNKSIFMPGNTLLHSLLLPQQFKMASLNNGNLNFMVTPANYNVNSFSGLIKVPALLTISHLLHRRILYLFDTFFETISQPDADLIRRQQKGTLFWDMWADFIVTAADYYNVNVAALSTIKAEQNTLIEKISNDVGNVLWPKASDRVSSLSSFTLKNNRQPNSINASVTVSLLANLNRWSVNQYITYQSWHSHNGSNNSNGDLFIDYHPPKSFSHIPAIKYNSILQQPIGTLVCQIYSGIFNKQISKNVLLVNTKTTAKQVSTDNNILLIQALAGETELKIITDNAQRYALVNRGFAIGIKLLRDVFDAIALNTPCIFLLEDIHAIGERRPMLISDFGGAMSDDNGSFKEDFFGGQRDEVHEKNQVIYQLTRHAITHYKKPFKGDYSLAIPTNLYVTDLFLKTPTQSTSNLTLIEKHNLTIKNKIKGKGINSVSNDTSAQLSSSKQGTLSKSSHLQIRQTISNFTPPSTSPFTVLLLKEEKKLKPNKIVEEFPWTGLPGEQLSTKPRTSYSVRAKVAMLAELSLSNLSAKLDMITDLLVIIDSVRSNKGFVVFATTDVPHVLDPALRRPGRLDETICMPSSNSNLTSNSSYEIIKSVKPFTNLQLTNGFNSIPTSFSTIHNNVNKYIKNYTPVLTVNLKDYSTVLGTVSQLPIAKHSENSSLNYALISHSNNLKRKTISDTLLHETFTGRKDSVLRVNPPVTQNGYGNESKSISNQLIERNMLHKKNKYKAIAYYEVGKVLLSYYLNLKTFDQAKNASRQCSVSNSTHPSRGLEYVPPFEVTPEIRKTTDSLNLKSINFLSLYGSKNKLILQLMLLFGGKISQLLSSKKNKLNANINLRGNLTITPSQTANFLDFDMSQLFERNSNFQIATSIMLAFIHKRYLYRKNLIVPKLLSFIDGNVLDEPPSPPFSSLLIPAKRFENYKRVFRDSIFGDKMGQRKAQISIIEKLQYHMQLRSIKLLNNISHGNISEKAKGVDLPLTGINGLPAEKFLQTTTNINWYYQNRILKRHGQYLTNQWWNGQLSEHNPETVFLSDIDWRSSFIKNKQINVIKMKNLYTLSQQKKHSDSLDVVLDFPDTDQYYNPRRRRWLLNKGYWSFWFNFDKVYSEEILSTWILESIVQTYTYLHNNTELLDFITNKYITLGYPNTDMFLFGSAKTLNNSDISLRTKTELSCVKEILLTNSFKRF